jgi:hypothetical protein
MHLQTYELKKTFGLEETTLKVPFDRGKTTPENG